MRFFGRWVAVLLVLGSSSACSLFKATPAKTSSFLPYDEKLTEQRERAPFHGIWFRDKEQFARLKESYRKVSLMPVNSIIAEERIRASNWYSDETKNHRIEDLREIARYTYETFRRELREVPKDTVLYVDRPDNNTLVLELALVEVIPTNPAVSVAGAAAGYFVPGSGLLRIAASGSIAIEGVVRDGRTGQVLVAFKDRESDKFAPFTVKDYQQYGHVREAVNDWAAQYAELATTSLEYQVADSFPLSINPL